MQRTPAHDKHKARIGRLWGGLRRNAPYFASASTKCTSCSILSFLAPVGSFAGMGMLALYYFAYPPLFAPGMGGPTEGNYLLVNKTLIE